MPWHLIIVYHVTYSLPKIVLCPYSTVKQGYENKDKYPHTLYYSLLLYVMFFSLIFFFSHYLITVCVNNFTLYTLSYNFYFTTLQPSLKRTKRTKYHHFTIMTWYYTLIHSLTFYITIPFWCTQGHIQIWTWLYHHQQPTQQTVEKYWLHSYTISIILIVIETWWNITFLHCISVEEFQNVKMASLQILQKTNNWLANIGRAIPYSTTYENYVSSRNHKRLELSTLRSLNFQSSE